MPICRAVAAGHFREDLFFRLNVLGFAVPPLRERPADIVPLAEHFLARLARGARACRSVAYDADAKRSLASTLAGKYSRTEKRASSTRWCSPKATHADADDFPESVRARECGRGAAACVRSRKSSAKRSQRRSKPRITRSRRAAEMLGISRKTLLDKRKKYGLN